MNDCVSSGSTTQNSVIGRLKHLNLVNMLKTLAVKALPGLD